MNTPLVVSIVSAVVATGSALFTGWNARGIEVMKARLAAEKEAAEKTSQIDVYRAPLSTAAYDLQSRLYNIIKKNLIGAYVDKGDVMARTYVIQNTVFVIAQFFCWAELARQKIHFIEMPSAEATQRLLRLQDRLQWEWSTDTIAPGFRIFAGEQRAIGEALIVGEPGYTTCMGYGAFLQAFPEGANRFIVSLRAEVMALNGGLGGAEIRLTRLQHTLIDILDVMDPDGHRFDMAIRSRL